MLDPLSPSSEIPFGRHELNPKGADKRKQPPKGRPIFPHIGQGTNLLGESIALSLRPTRRGRVSQLNRVEPIRVMLP